MVWAGTAIKKGGRFGQLLCTFLIGGGFIIIIIIIIIISL